MVAGVIFSNEDFEHSRIRLRRVALNPAYIKKFLHASTVD